jgi:hypothetical protein
MLERQPQPTKQGSEKECTWAYVYPQPEKCWLGSLCTLCRGSSSPRLCGGPFFRQSISHPTFSTALASASAWSRKRWLGIWAMEFMLFEGNPLSFLGLVSYSYPPRRFRKCVDTISQRSEWLLSRLSYELSFTTYSPAISYWNCRSLDDIGLTIYYEPFNSRFDVTCFPLILQSINPLVPSFKKISFLSTLFSNIFMRPRCRRAIDRYTFLEKSIPFRRIRIIFFFWDS